MTAPPNNFIAPVEVQAPTGKAKAYALQGALSRAMACGPAPPRAQSRQCSPHIPPPMAPATNEPARLPNQRQEKRCLGGRPDPNRANAAPTTSNATHNERRLSFPCPPHHQWNPAQNHRLPALRGTRGETTCTAKNHALNCPPTWGSTPRGVAPLGLAMRVLRGTSCVTLFHGTHRRMGMIAALQTASTLSNYAVSWCACLMVVC